MAERLQSFAFPRRGRRPRYPWEQWLDGSTWMLRSGEDFPAGAARSVVELARCAGRCRAKLIRSCVDDGGNVTLRAIPKDAAT